METTFKGILETLEDLPSPPPSSSPRTPKSTPVAAPPLPLCMTCGDTGWLRVDRPLTDPRFGKLEPCECQGDRELERLRGLSGLHGEELTVRIEEMNVKFGPGTAAMIEACKQFVAEPRGFLTLWGGVGVGKTTCLYGITNALMRRGSLYVSLHDLLEFVRAGFDSGDPHDDARSRLKRFIGVRVLCLDELDKVRPTDWAAEQLTALVDARFRSAVNGETGTVLALNSDPATQPPWIASRLADGRCRIVHNADGDARRHMNFGL